MWNCKGITNSPSGIIIRDFSNAGRSRKKNSTSRNFATISSISRQLISYNGQ